MLIVLALKEESVILSEVRSFLSNFIMFLFFFHLIHSLLSSDDAMSVWSSADSFRSCFASKFIIILPYSIS